MRGLASLLAVIWLLLPAWAYAGDYAERDILGFSPSGKYFAFEEYGVGDGSGFSYSTIYVIDTVDNSWAEGTPIRVNPQSEDVSLDAARAEARKKAAPVLKRLEIGKPGFLVVSNPPTELDADRYKVHFAATPWFNSGPSSWNLTLSPITFDDPPGCADLGPIKGFRLVLDDLGSGKSWTLQEDKSIPTSRNCPQDYAITDVITYYPNGYNPAIVVLISKYSQGFEGPDRRFLAVAGEFEGQ